jgi:hypothetical protein
MELSLRARVRAGDPDAFGALYDECARAVYNHAFRLTGSWSAAEEVVSLTFLEAWRLRGKVEPDGGPLRPWLLGIAGNVAALIPGVTVVSDAVNAVGRHGVAVAIMAEGAHGVRDVREEWIFDRTTLQMIGVRTVAHGSVTDVTAIVDRAFVDRAGEISPRAAESASLRGQIQMWSASKRVLSLST